MGEKKERTYLRNMFILLKGFSSSTPVIGAYRSKNIIHNMWVLWLKLLKSCNNEDNVSASALWSRWSCVKIKSLGDYTGYDRKEIIPKEKGLFCLL